MPMNNGSLARFLLFVFVLQAISIISIFLDIPFIRQFSGFVFLTFIPGFLILRIFHLEKIGITISILLSVALSLSFLMLLGFLASELSLINLISNPLSVWPFTLIINFTVSLMCVFVYFKNVENTDIFSKEVLRGLFQSLIYLILPILSILGVYLVLTFHNNLLLIVLLFLISAIFLVTLFSSKSTSHYPAIIVCTGIALLLSVTLVSMYMYGTDVSLEYNVFKQTQLASSLNWQAVWLQQSSYKSMLSVTVLPTIFSNLLNIDGGWVFKILFPLIFSLVPLGLYEIYKTQWSKKVAFVAVVFFMANYMFYGLMPTVTRQMIAQLFYVLLFLIILKDNGEYTRNKWVITMFLVFGLIVSHYSMSYIFLFIVSLAIIGGKLLKNKRMKIKSTIVAFSFCLTFFWYLNIAQGPFENLVNVTRSTFNSFLSEFFYAGSRGEPIQMALGLVESQTIVHDLGRYVFNITSLLILIGFIALIFKWRKKELDPEYGIITSMNMGLLVLTILLPRFASFLEMSRFYQIALMFLSPLLVVGVCALFEIIPSLRREKKRENKRRKRYCLLFASIIVIIFLLFQTGFIYEVTNDPLPSSIALSYDKMKYSIDLTPQCDVYSAFWLSNYCYLENTVVWADTVSILRVLTSYSTIDRSLARVLSNTTTYNIYPSRYIVMKNVENFNFSYIYLREFNVDKGMVVYNTKTNEQFEINELPILNNTGVFINKIYSNSGSEIYFRTS